MQRLASSARGACRSSSRCSAGLQWLPGRLRVAVVVALVAASNRLVVRPTPTVRANVPCAAADRHISFNRKPNLADAARAASRCALSRIFRTLSCSPFLDAGRGFGCSFPHACSLRCVSCQGCPVAMPACLVLAPSLRHIKTEQPGQTALICSR